MNLIELAEKIEKDQTNMLMRMSISEAMEHLEEYTRGVPRYWRFRWKILHLFAERHKRLHTKRDRYSAGSKRGRRR